MHLYSMTFITESEGKEATRMRNIRNICIHEFNNYLQANNL
jgi:hypothetical protein